MKIASWNVNSLNARLPHLEAWLASRQPDIAVLQETKVEDARFPKEALQGMGYHALFCGQKTYNGVAIVSREPMTNVQAGIPGFDDEQKRAMAVSFGPLRVVNLYVVNGQSVGSPKYEYKLRWLAAVRDWLATEIAQHPDLIVLGDFNVAPDDRDVHDPDAWREEVLCSTPEREALQRILALGLHDSFRLHNDEGGVYSWWDYRQGRFRRDHGLRIDLGLVSDSLKARCTLSAIDREPRTWERPSDHAPVIVEIE